MFTQQSGYQVGDRVWLSTRDLRLDLPSRKLIGAFVITAQVNPVTLKLLLPSHMHIHPVFYVSLLRPLIKGPLQSKKRSPVLSSAVVPGGRSSPSTPLPIGLLGEMQRAKVLGGLGGIWPQGAELGPSTGCTQSRIGD